MRSQVKAVLLVGAMLVLSGSLYAQAPNWPAERPPQPLPARDVKFPPYEIRTLQNGLQVVVVQHHEQPILTVRMLIRSGAASDPSQKQGVAVLTAALLDQGTRDEKRGADRRHHRLDRRRPRHRRGHGPARTPTSW